MSSGLSLAVDQLEEELKRQLQEVSETKRMINMLLRRMGEAARYSEEVVDTGAVRNDQYYGKPLATAVTDVLTRRKNALSAEAILEELVKGAFSFEAVGWAEQHRLRNLAISLTKNTKSFHRLPNGNYGLTEWYDEKLIAPKKTKTEADDGAKESAQKADAPSAENTEGDLNKEQ